MAAQARLLERITGETSTLGPLLVPLRSLLIGPVRAFWPGGVQLHAERQWTDACRVIESSGVQAYRLTGPELWSSLDEIQGAFKERNEDRRRSEARTGAKTSCLPAGFVNSPLKLLIRDKDNPIQCCVSGDQVYPKRAWVALLHSTQTVETLFVIAGLLNSAMGQVLYRRVASVRPRKSHDIRKDTLLDIRVPLLGYDQDTFERAASLSYRLHCLYAANADCRLPAEVVDVDVRNHWFQLLSELVRLYGYEEADAEKLVEKVLPEGLKDVPGFQGELYYRPKSPLLAVKLLATPDLERYEELKRKVRERIATEDQRLELSRLQSLMQWEVRINGPIPQSIASSRWVGVRTSEDAVRIAARYLSDNRGQAWLPESARQLGPRLWEVSIARRERASVGAGNSAAAVSAPLHETLHIDGITGEVTARDRELSHAHPAGA